MIWVAQKNDKLNWLLLWYNLNSIKRIHAFTSIFFLSAVAVDVHLLSLMFSFYAFQRFIYSFINSYLILIFHWTRGCVCFLSGCSGAGGFSGRSLYVCIQSVLCSPITLVSTDVENVSLFFISPLSFRSLLQKQMQHCRVKLHSIHWEINAFISLQNQKKTARKIVLHCNIIFYFTPKLSLAYCNTTKHWNLLYYLKEIYVRIFILITF